MQRYSTFNKEEHQNAEFLLRAYPDLRFAYLEEEPARKEGGDPRIFSALIDGHNEFIPATGSLTTPSWASVNEAISSPRSSATQRLISIFPTGRTRILLARLVICPSTPIWELSKHVAMTLNPWPMSSCTLRCPAMARSQGCYQEAEIRSYHGKEDDHSYGFPLPRIPR